MGLAIGMFRSQSKRRKRNESTRACQCEVIWDGPPTAEAALKIAAHVYHTFTALRIQQ